MSHVVTYLKYITEKSQYHRTTRNPERLFQPESNIVLALQKGKPIL